MKTTKAINFYTALLALLLGLAGVPAGASDQPEPRILVTGQGSAHIAPDMAVLNLTVMREAATARKALDANSAAMAEVIAAMTAAGIAEKDLQTANFSIQPRYNQPPRKANGERPTPRIVAYTVRNSLTVRVRDINKVGEILDKSVTLGANEGGNIQFTNDDPLVALTEARRNAVADALAKANTLADAAGVEVGDIVEISEQSYRPRPMSMARAEMSMDMGGAVPVAAGENSYSVTVNITVAIEQ